MLRSISVGFHRCNKLFRRKFNYILKKFGWNSPNIWKKYFEQILKFLIKRINIADFVRVYSHKMFIAKMYYMFE